MPKFLLFYDVAPDAGPGLKAAFPEHVARLHVFHDRGLLIAAGPVGEPPTSALGIFSTREGAEEFVAGDPFVQRGLVASWRVAPWNALFL